MATRVNGAQRPKEDAPEEPSEQTEEKSRATGDLGMQGGLFISVLIGLWFVLFPNTKPREGRDLPKATEQTAIKWGLRTQALGSGLLQSVPIDLPDPSSPCPYPTLCLFGSLQDS